MSSSLFVYVLFKAYFPLGNFLRAAPKQGAWLKLVSEKIRREQVETVSTFCLFARTKLPKDNGFWPGFRSRVFFHVHTRT